MITDYFSASRTLNRMRSNCLGQYLDGLAGTLADAGYAANTIRQHLCTAVHLARWADRRKLELASWDDDMLAGFARYLAQRGLAKRDRMLVHSTQLLRFLRERALIAPARATPSVPSLPAILERFAGWMIRHRGIVQSTLRRYTRFLRVFVAQLGENPARYDVAKIRSFVIDHLGRYGRGEARSSVIAIRSFLRFLVVEGRVPPGMDLCVPTVPQWHLSSLPRYLESAEVERVVGSCDLSAGHGLRDHAILLLLSRLGLRAGDIVGMVLEDIDWRHGTLLVRGKSHQEAILPLPQDVGDALVAYLKRGRPKSASERIFLTVHAPTRPFASSATVSDIVRFALERAGVHSPSNRGAHLLRHSAATAMLRAGSSLDTIATVLRHRSPDTTAYYAKVDVVMLQQIAQPWPGASC